MLSVNGVSSNIFLTNPSTLAPGASSVELVPVVSGEWNQNAFNTPFVTVAGNGVKQTIGTSTPAFFDAGSNSMTGQTTGTFTMSTEQAQISFPITCSGKTAYKIVTYVSTNKALPIMLNAYAKGSSSQFGSASIDVNAYGFQKVEIYVGSSGAGDLITSLTFNMVFNTYESKDIDTTGPISIYYTVPQVYETTYFDYQHHSLWPTDSVFQNFRPGESYVYTGNSNASLPSQYRKISSPILDGYTNTVYPPISPIVQNPSFSAVGIPVPIYKNSMATDMSAYKYFVSEADPNLSSPTYGQSVTGIYKNVINANKIILKFNALVSTPTLSVQLDGATIASSITPDSNGLLILYYNGATWSTSKWTTMPQFAANGSVTMFKPFSKITVTQTGSVPAAGFSGFTSPSVKSDLTRFHVIEISPRLEIDLSDYVMTLDINKSLDSKNNYVPISSVNANDASLVLSAIPVYYQNSLVPLFSSQSDLNISILSQMLRKNIKFYFNFNLVSYFNGSNVNVNQYIPAGVFYSDVWDETDIQTVKVSCYDITQYLQTVPVTDYVSNLQSVFDTLTNLMDLTGFTDYDYDSLYQICNDNASATDLYYYYSNSQDLTLIDALSEIFLAYQIGAYIDEWGIMRFLSLSDIMQNQTPVATIYDGDVITGGYAITNKQKPGAISIRYQEPKMLQSLALQNVSDTSLTSPSFIYTTSNDVVWSQQNVDSVGFNYLDGNMAEADNKFLLNNNDLLDVFHTYLLNNNGYAFIENEIVSFVYKQYEIYQASNPSNSVTVSVKNDIELASAINSFTKAHQVALITANTPETKGGADVTVNPTGYITGVERGLFGTVASDHNIISGSLSSKSLSEGTISTSNYSISTGTSNTTIWNNKLDAPDNPSVEKVKVTAPNNQKVIIYPTDAIDQGYKTYSVKFDLDDQRICSAGLFFNAPSNLSSSDGTYFVELAKVWNATTNSYQYLVLIYQAIGGSIEVISWTDATGNVDYIIKNFEQVLFKVPGTSGQPNSYSYESASDQCFNLKVVHYNNGEDSTTGENINSELIEVFLNNIELSGWQTPSTSGAQFATGWQPMPKNTVTNIPQKVNIGNTLLNTLGTKFGFFASTNPVAPTGTSYSATPSSNVVGNFREIYAVAKPLKERSVSYYYQDREFLNGLVQKQNLFAQYKSYMVQTNPEVSGINYYDVQYTTPAACSVDVLPISYLWYYFPGTQPQDQNYYQKQVVNEDALSYSTPLNTGFRAKMAIANNSSHMVYLKKDADSVNQFTVTLNLWTHQLIAPSDASLLSRVIDPANPTEVIQLDSPWIQSRESANKLLDVITIGNDGFSRDTAVQIFGNPLIQVGDILTMNYTLAGIQSQKYLVHEVAHTFDKGLKTTLTLNSLSMGVKY